MHRPLAALCLLGLTASCAVFGMSDDERQRLTSFQRNAKYYLEGGIRAASVAERERHYEQALRMVDKGLEIDAADYHLRMLRGWVYLGQAETDRNRLLAAERAFDELYEERSPDDHDPQLLLGYADCHKQLGVHRRRQAEALQQDLERPGVTPAVQLEREAQATEATTRGVRHLQKAESALAALVARQELLRFAYKQMMDIAIEFGHYESAVDCGRQCLERIATEKAGTQRLIDSTMSRQYEREQRTELRKLVAMELRARSALAEMHYRKGHYELAIDQLDAILALDNQRWDDYYNRGRAHEELGDVEAARRDFNRFLTAGKLPSSDKRVQHAIGIVYPDR